MLLFTIDLALFKRFQFGILLVQLLLQLQKLRIGGRFVYPVRTRIVRQVDPVVLGELADGGLGVLVPCLRI